MKKVNILHVLIAFVAGGLAVWFFANPSNVSNSSKSSNSTNMMGQNIDSHFIIGMIPHHEDAIKMAKLALIHAEHNEIKTLSQSIIESQTKENILMAKLYKNWFGKDPQNSHAMHGGMQMGMMGDTTDLIRLENAENFDKAFIEGMIPHHQMAIMMAEMLKNGTQKTEMKKLADDIIKAQSQEIEMMRQWYGDWGYNDTSL